MSNTIILDSYDYAEALKAANVPEAQIKAEVARDREHIKAINKIIDNNLATKHDIALIHKDIVGLYTFGYLICGLIIVSVSLLTILIVHYG